MLSTKPKGLKNNLDERRDTEPPKRRDWLRMSLLLVHVCFCGLLFWTVLASLSRDVWYNQIFFVGCLLVYFKMDSLLLRYGS